jgi:predicted Na+-dependent transporter
MEEQSVAVQYFLPFTVAMIMFAMGLGLVVGDFRRIFEKPRAVMIGLGAQLVLLPVLGFAVAFGFRDRSDAPSLSKSAFRTARSPLRSPLASSITWQ